MGSTKPLQQLLVTLLLTLSFVTAMPTLFTRPIKAQQTSVTVSSFAFNPQNVTVKVGSTIMWTNNDAVIHTLWFTRVNDQSTYALSPPIIPGESWSQTFNEIVTLQYYCFEGLWITGFINVVPLVPPVASFTCSPTEALVNQEITFDASQSYDSDGTIVSYAWIFSDGTTLTEADALATHVFTEDGTYDVTLTVTDDDGLTSSTWKTITVLPVHDVAVISVTPAPAEVTIEENVTITVGVMNEGTVAETFVVTAYSNNTEIDAQTVTNLAAGGSETLEFVWNTINATEGIYVIRAEASHVTGEADTADNMFTSDVTVTVKAVFIIFPYIGIIALILFIIAIILLALGAYVYIRRKRISES